MAKNKRGYTLPKSIILSGVLAYSTLIAKAYSETSIDSACDENRKSVVERIASLIHSNPPISLDQCIEQELQAENRKNDSEYYRLKSTDLSFRTNSETPKALNNQMAPSKPLLKKNLDGYFETSQKGGKSSNQNVNGFSTIEGYQ